MKIGLRPREQQLGQKEMETEELSMFQFSTWAGKVNRKKEVLNICHFLCNLIANLYNSKNQKVLS